MKKNPYDCYDYNKDAVSFSPPVNGSKDTYKGPPEV